MLISALILWTIAAILSVMVVRRKQAGLRHAGAFALDQSKAMAMRLPFAVLTASFLAEILPASLIGGLLGSESGVGGIFLASLVGGLLPGGPMVSFPIAVFLYQAGAGTAQLTALVAGWSLFAFHRIIAFELPIMGWRFVVLRLVSSLILPPLAGLAAAGLVEIGGWTITQ